MKTVIQSVPQLEGLEPYDPQYLPAEVLLSANESPYDIPVDLRAEIASALAELPFNRYPDPLANDLREMIAQANGLTRDQVLLGNGGDELLFNVALAYGCAGRKMINLVPTFSVYALNARLNNTEVVEIPRRTDLSIDEEAVLARVAEGDISYIVITSPNNPTGDLASHDFVERLLKSTDALVLLDEAYGEFSDQTCLDLLKDHKNLLILHTFSKAFSLAGIRLGYLLGSEEVIREFIKFRQPYSVDAVSQAIAQVVYAHRAVFQQNARELSAAAREVAQRVAALPQVQAVYPTDANFFLFKVPLAGLVWQKLYDQGVLVRDFSRCPGLTNCLRVTVGSPEENEKFLSALEHALSTKNKRGHRSPCLLR